MDILSNTEVIPMTAREKELARKMRWAEKKRREEGIAPRILKTQEEKNEKLKQVNEKKKEYSRRKRSEMTEEEKKSDLAKRKECRQAKPLDVNQEISKRQYTKRKESWTPEQVEAYNARRRELYHQKKMKKVIATAL
jgi:hypothetical protein